MRNLLRFAFILILFGFNISMLQATTTKRLVDGWEYIKGDLGGPWESWRKAKGDSLGKWERVQLPHCFNASDAVDPDVKYYQGPGWYRTRLEIDNPFPNGRTLLHFEGAGQKTEIYVFETKVGSHVGGYDEFTVDITRAVKEYRKLGKDGGVPVTVRCDNSRDLEMIPSDLSDFNLYGGLYRYVNLIYVPEISLERVHVGSALQTNGDAFVEVKARLRNPEGRTDAFEVNVSILDPNGEMVFEEKSEQYAWGTRRILVGREIKDPFLWSTKKPLLYQCLVTLESKYGKHVVAEKFGVRSFEFVKNGPFRLNNERLLLRGTHRHEDHAGVAAAMTEEMMRQEMQMMKEMGVNFIRLGHYQQSSIILDLCDELGFLVWEEIPWCRGGLGGERYKQQARDMLTAMIDQHYNHPSVILWGLGNENDWPGDFNEFDKEKIRVFMTELHNLSHELDPSRKTAIRRCSFCRDIVDVYSPSIWAGWYRGKYTEYQEVSKREMKTVDHFLHVEWGASNHARRHSENPDNGLENIMTGDGADERSGDFLSTGGKPRVSKDGTWTETYACNLIDWHLKEQEKMDWLTGTAYWPFKDFSTPLRPENPVPYVNQKGVVERDFTKKEAFYVFQSYWTEEPMVRIYGHSWPVRWGAEGEKRMLKVYSNCEEVELYLNGKSLGKRKRDSQNFPAAGLRWASAFKTGVNQVKAVAVKDGITIIDELTFEYESRKWGKATQLEFKTISQVDDVATLQVYALDKNGIRCLDSRNEVRFGITGDGKLLDNLGTSRGSRVVQLHNGRAEIDVDLKRGHSIVSANGEGFDVRFIELGSGRTIAGVKSRPVE